MRTRFILSFIAALFMQFATVSADNYTDGIMKLMNNDAMASFNTKAFEQMSQIPQTQHRQGTSHQRLYHERVMLRW